MNVGLIGFSASGRSTLYRAAARGAAKGSVTAVPVPDSRFDAIVEQVKPKKATPATVVLHDDIVPIEASGKMFGARFLEDARNADLLLHVVRAFDSPSAPYHDTVDPIRDVEAVSVEALLTDLQIVESRLERLHKSQASREPGHPEYVERALFSRIKGPLGDGTPLRAMDLNEEEQRIVRSFQFLTAKQMVVAFNVGEDCVTDPGDAIRTKIAELAEHNVTAFWVCATLEEEVAQLDPADQPEFLAGLGLNEPAADKVIRAVYAGLGLITFFTAGENDTRAWPLRKGSTALKAADTIHSDIARGFIRAEITHWEDYVAHGSLHAAQIANKMHLEGKEYIIRDGDLIHIRNKT